MTGAAEGTSCAAKAAASLFSDGGACVWFAASLFCLARIRIISFLSSSMALFWTFLIVPPQWITLILNDAALAPFPDDPSTAISTGLEIKVALAQTSLAASREHRTIAVPV